MVNNSFKETVYKPSVKIIKTAIIISFVLVIFMLSSSLVNGLTGFEYLETNTRAYWGLNDNNFSSHNNLYNMSNGGTDNITAFTGSGRYIDATSDYLNISTSIIDSQDFMFCLWVNVTLIGGYGLLYYDNASTKTNYAFDYASGLRWYRTKKGVSSECTAVNGTLTNGAVHHLCVGYDGSRMVTYRNGVMTQNCSASGSGTTATNNNLSITRDNPPANTLRSIVDEVYWFNKILTVDEASFLFNNGISDVLHTYPFSDNTTVFNISINVYNTSQINNFTLEFNNNGTLYTTTNGTVYLINVNLTNTVNISVTGLNNYYEINYTNKLLSTTNILYVNSIINSQLISPCNQSYTLNSTGVIIFFDYTNDSVHTPYIYGRQGLIYRQLTINYGNNTINNTFNGVYNLYSNQTLSTLQNQNCTITFCNSVYVRTPAGCIGNLKYVNYTDSNNCAIYGYDLPSDTGTYENCSSPANTDKELWFIIILLGLWVMSIILTITVFPFTVILSFVSGTGLMFYLIPYFALTTATAGLIIFLVLSITLFSIVIGLRGKN